MATKSKKDKQHKATSRRASALGSLAQHGGQSGSVSSHHILYKDHSSRDVHEGKATLSGNVFTDAGSRATYGRAVKQGHGKTLFRYQGKLYQTINSSGTASAEVKV